MIEKLLLILIAILVIQIRSLYKRIDELENELSLEIGYIRSELMIDLRNQNQRLIDRLVKIAMKG